MSKVIFLVVVVIGVVIIIGIVRMFMPTVRTVSEYSFLRPLLQRPVTLKSEGTVYETTDGGHRFLSLVLDASPSLPYPKKLVLPVGSMIVIKDFKTYKSNIGSGLTFLYAIGETTTASGEKIEFEYSWGGTDPSFSSGEAALLPHAIWQDSAETQLRFVKE